MLEQQGVGGGRGAPAEAPVSVLGFAADGSDKYLCRAVERLALRSCGPRRESSGLGGVDWRVPGWFRVNHALLYDNTLRSQKSERLADISGKRKRDRAVSDSMRPSSSPSSAPSTAAIPPAEPSSIEAAQALPTVTMGGATLSNDNLTHLFGENGFAFDIGNWLLPQLSLAAHGIPDVPPPPAASHTLLDPATLAFVLDLVPTFYERNVYIITLLPYAYIDARTHRGDHDTAPDFAALLVAMAANVLLHTVEAAEAFEGTRVLRARELLDLACRLKGSSACGVGVGIDAVLSSFLLFLCFFGIAEQDAAWYRLRESLTCELHERLEDQGK